jgi:type IV secretory pathway VirD2 relaxase
MSADDENRFRPRPGRIRSDARAGKTKSFLTQAKKIARQHSTASSRSSPRPGKTATTKGGKGARSAKGPGVRRGRGAAFVRARTLSGGWRHSAPGMRRVVVKTRYVKDAGRNGRAAAHLRYIQRDGTSRDGERGQLYSATEDRADGAAFLDRGKDDRHQFRFIVSPEDGADLSDLTAHTRDLMRQVEADLGTKLDWVAVNHHNTGHPHVHVIVRGKDDLGENLVINGDYLANGIRERASELTTLELGPVTEIEQTRKLSAEIDQDRFTRIDRAMVEEADDRFLDLRQEPAEPRRQFNRTLRLRRLAKLDKMGLATEHAPGVWELSERMEPTLREMGERGDIIRNMHRALKADGLERDPLTFQIHDGPPEKPIVGRMVDKYLSDELGENLTVVVDGIDGRTHHVAGIDPARVEDARIGSVVEIGPADTAPRPPGRTGAGTTSWSWGFRRTERGHEQASHCRRSCDWNAHTKGIGHHAVRDCRLVSRRWPRNQAIQDRGLLPWSLRQGRAGGPSRRPACAHHIRHAWRQRRLRHRPQSLHVAGVGRGDRPERRECHGHGTQARFWIGVLRRAQTDGPGARSIRRHASAQERHGLVQPAGRT